MVQEQVIERSSNPEAGILVVWVDMLRFDSEKASRKAIGKLFGQDPRVRHFWDPKNRVPAALAAGFDWAEDDLAWDIYLFYDQDAEWTDQAATSAAYFHQMSRHQDDTAHFFQGKALAKKIAETADKLFQKPVEK